MVEDFTGQIRRRARNVPRDAKVGEVVLKILDEMHLPANDSEGRGLTYGVRSNGVSVGESELVGDVLEEDAVVTLTPNITAG
jgi:hypothetical protein